MVLRKSIGMTKTMRKTCIKLMKKSSMIKNNLIFPIDYQRKVFKNRIGIIASGNFFIGSTIREVQEVLNTFDISLSFSISIEGDVLLLEVY